MASVVWPVDLPNAPLVSSLVAQYESLAIRTRMDQGPAKVRRRFTRNVRPFRVEFIMTDTQLAIFDVFFHATIKGGAERYSWTDPIDGLNGDFRVIGTPEVTPLTARTDPAPKFRVGFTVEKMPDIVEEADGPPPGDPPPVHYSLYEFRIEPLVEPLNEFDDGLYAPLVIPKNGGDNPGIVPHMKNDNDNPVSIVGGPSYGLGSPSAGGGSA